MYTVEPRDDDERALRSQAPSRTSIVMLNLLRFRERADYQADAHNAAPCSGKQAYARYSKAVVPMLLRVRGAPLWHGDVTNRIIGPAAESWDEVVLVAYPHRRAFMRMVESDAYGAIRHHRSAGLLDSRLFEMRARFIPPTVLKLVGWAYQALERARPTVR